MTSTYQIEMVWQCSVCQHRGNRGLKDRYCCNCGHKKCSADAEHMPDDTSEASALTGDDDRKARAGADWVCAYCESLQNQLNKCCGNCGAEDRPGPKVAPEVRELRHLVHAPAALDDDSSGDDAAPAVHVEKTRAPRWNRARAHLPAALVAAAVALLGFGARWLFAPRTVDAVVTGVYWRHEVVIERYQVNAEEGFVPRLGAFDITTAGMRHHHYDHVHVGSHQEPYQESYTCGQDCYTTPRSRSCSSNGNGTATCTESGGDRVCSSRTCYRTAYRTVQDYEDVSRQAMWYTWRAWGWAYNRTIAHEGHDKATKWPTGDELRPARIGDGEKERATQRGSYSIFFAFDDERVSLHPETEAEFAKYDTSQRRRLKVNRVGSVEVLP